MKFYGFIFAVLLSANALAENFNCSVDSYAEKVNSTSTNLKQKYEAVMNMAVEKWFKKAGGELADYENFEVLIFPSKKYSDAVDFKFTAAAISKNGKKFYFSLEQHIFVSQGNHPLDNSIMTCGPWSGLPVVFHPIDVTDSINTKVDSQRPQHIWGEEFCYQYKIEI